MVKPTRPWTLLLIAVLAGTAAWAVLTAVYASLPPLSWTGVPALLIAAGAEAWFGRDLRARIQGKRGGRPAPPLFVARVVALAKASSQTAALLAGVCAGGMVYLSGLASAPTPRSDLVNASLSFGACLVLLAAALFLEYCCRVPHDGDTDDVPPPPRESPFHGLRRAMAKPPSYRAADQPVPARGRPPGPPLCGVQRHTGRRLLL